MREADCTTSESRLPCACAFEEIPTARMAATTTHTARHVPTSSSPPLSIGKGTPSRQREGMVTRRASAARALGYGSGPPADADDRVREDEGFALRTVRLSRRKAAANDGFDAGIPSRHPTWSALVTWPSVRLRAARSSPVTPAGTTLAALGTDQHVSGGRLAGPIRGARLTVQDGTNKGAQVTSDLMGRYSFTQPGEGRFTMRPLRRAASSAWLLLSHCQRHRGQLSRSAGPARRRMTPTSASGSSARWIAARERLERRVTRGE
jgi:hypothetical protein